jgi:hypothetical protein
VATFLSWPRVEVCSYGYKGRGYGYASVEIGDVDGLVWWVDCIEGRAED